MLLIFVTCDVSNVEVSSVVIAEHPLNILLISVTLVVFKWERSSSVSALQQ